MSDYITQFASMSDYQKGKIDIVDDNIKRYVFSNMFEIAKNSAPYEKVVAAKNLEYVVEVVKAWKESPFYISGHDEFMLVMQGSIKIEFFLPKNDFEEFPDAGADIISHDKLDKQIGTVIASRGHLVLLPQKIVYRCISDEESVFLLQTILGKHSIEKWSDICVTQS